MEARLFIVLLAALLLLGCAKKQETDYTELVSTLDEADKIDYRELVSIMFVVAKDWNENKSSYFPIYKYTKEPGVTAKMENTTIRLIGHIEEDYYSFARERGVDIVLVDAESWKGERAIVIWDHSDDQVGKIVRDLLSEEEIEQIGRGERTFFISEKAIVIAGKDRNLTERAVAENFFPAVWIMNGNYERAAKANLEAALELGEKVKIDLGLKRDEIEEAVRLRNLAKLAYYEGDSEKALSLYEKSLSIGKDVPALCGKAQVLGSRFKGDISCYVSKCPICGSDVVGILSISSKEIIWARHKPG